jgi:tRNA dimethylallyltransferase
MKKPLLILTGPTAVGKTDLSLHLAKKMQGEIISADSMQVYRGMNIGTAKLPLEQREGIPHHMIDIMDPQDSFDVTRFQAKCFQLLPEIDQRKHLPMIVGGTGFYIQSILYHIDFTQAPEDSSYRQKLQTILQEKGENALYEILLHQDTDYAKMVHPHNTKRVMRALTYQHETGFSFSKHNQEQHQKESPYSFRYYVLTLPRPILYQNIEQRVDQMREQGLTEEVHALYEKGYTRNMVSMQGIGYKELLSFFAGETTLDEAYALIKQRTKHFAKRQLTWFRREKDVTWIEKNEFADTDALAEYIYRDFQACL